MEIAQRAYWVCCCDMAYLLMQFFVICLDYETGVIDKYVD